MHNLEDAVRELSTYFESALPLYDETVRCLAEMKSEARLSVEAKAVMFSTAEIEETGRALKRRPSVVFIGNRNCGKSAILNELLQGSYLPVDETPCTSRIVKISYSSGENSVRVVNKGGKELRPLVKFSGKSEKVVREYTVVPAQRREDKEELSATVEIKLNHPLLQSGIELIDSPGRNENDALNDIVDGFFEEGSTPLVVYIIDGNEQLRNTDREAIRLLQDKCPHMSFIFVCNKVDVSTAAQKYDYPDSSDEDEDTADKRDKEKTVFLQLQRHGFLPEDVTLDSCRNFHGISALNVRKERKARTTKGKTATAVFARFEQCLLEILHQTFKRQTREAAEKVLSMLLRFIAALDIEINALSSQISNPESILTFLSRVDISFFGKVLSVILASENELKSIVKLCLINLEIHCVQQALHFNPETAICSSREIEALATAMSRLVTKGNVFSPETDVMHTGTLQFLAFIRGIILDKAFNTLRCEVNAYLPSTINDSILQEVIPSLNVKSLFLKGLPTTYIRGTSVVLLDKLKEVASAALREELSQALEEGIRSEEGLMSLEKVHGNRATVVRRILSNIREERITKTITEACKAFVNQEIVKSKETLNTMRIVTSILSQSRLKWVAILYVSRVKCLALRGYAIFFFLSKRRLTLGPLLKHTKLNKFRSCTGWSNDPCVVKIIKKNKVGADVWEQTASDITDSWHIQNALDSRCPNLLRLHGWLIPQPGTLQIVMERADLSLTSTLQSGLLRKMSSRAKIALGIANGINKIHQVSVVELDLKADSILVSTDLTAKINLAKPEKPFEKTSQGTPFHISKEMYANYGNGLGSDFSYDIYAFGMLLWVLCEGSGARRPKVYEQYDTIEKMKIAVGKNIFPERPQGTPDTWWNLMTKCWTKREDLTSEDVLSEMTKIVEES